MLQRAEEDIPELSKRAVKEVFLNVDQLLPIHKHLLDGIIQRIDLWGEIQLFGDIFLKMVKNYFTQILIKLKFSIHLINGFLGTILERLSDVL